jgi:hypothetical protein
MSILTKPSITKGISAQFTLSRSQLVNHPLIQADSYFQNTDNWYRVNVVYKSSPGSQYEIVEFDATQSNPVGRFLVSEKARDLFQVEKVVILDFDGGYLEIPRTDLDVVDWDIQL